MASPNLQGMRAFRAVAETHSFRKAGVALGLSGSAVSKLVAALEHELGALLLQRTTRSVSLTDAGETFYEAAVRVLDETDAAVEHLRTDVQQPQGHLRVSVPTSFALRWLSQRVPDFLVLYPAVQLELGLNDRLVDLVAERYDCALRIGSELPDSTLVVRRIGTVPRVLVASPRYLKGAPALVAPADLARHVALLHSLSRTGRSWPFIEGGRSVQTQVSGRLTVDNSVMLRDTLLAGLGLALTPHFVVQDLLDSGQLVALLPEHMPPHLGIYGVTTQRRHVPLKTRLFLDFVETSLRSSGYAATPAPGGTEDPPRVARTHWLGPAGGG